jgi:hypothetical protein
LPVHSIRPAVRHSSSVQLAACCWFVCGFCSLPGCGNHSVESRLDQAIPDRETVVPVSGIVLLDDLAEMDLTIRLVRDDATAPAPSDPKAVTDRLGKFKFTTYMDGDGVPPGKYRMLIEQLARQGSSGWGSTDKLENRFNYLTDPVMTIEVAKGAPVEGLKIDLNTSDKPAQPAPPYTRPITGKPIKSRP